MKSMGNIASAFKEYYKNRKTKYILRRLRKIEIEVSNLKDRVNKIWYGDRRQSNGKK